MSYGGYSAPCLYPVSSMYNPYSMTPWVESTAAHFVPFPQPTTPVSQNGYCYYPAESTYYQHPSPRGMEYQQLHPSYNAIQSRPVSWTPYSHPSSFDGTDPSASQVTVSPTASSTPPAVFPHPSSPPTNAQDPLAYADTTRSVTSEHPRVAISSNEVSSPPLPPQSTGPESIAIEREAVSIPNAATVSPQPPAEVVVPPASLPAPATAPTVAGSREAASETPPSMSATLSETALRDLVTKLIIQRQIEESSRLLENPVDSPSPEPAMSSVASTSNETPMPSTAPYQPPIPYGTSISQPPIPESSRDAQQRYHTNQQNYSLPAWSDPVQEDHSYRQEYYPRHYTTDQARCNDYGRLFHSQSRPRREPADYGPLEEDSPSFADSLIEGVSQLGSLARSTGRLLRKGLSWCGSSISQGLTSLEEYAIEADLSPSTESSKGNLKHLNKRGEGKKGLLTRSSSPGSTMSSGSKMSKRSHMSKVFSRKQGNPGDSGSSWASDGEVAKLTRKQKKALKKQLPSGLSCKT